MKWWRVGVGIVALGIIGSVGFGLANMVHAAQGDYEAAVRATPGLKAYWKLDGNQSTALSDSVGTRTATLVGAPSFNQPGALVNDSATSIGFNGSSKLRIDNASAIITSDPNTPKPMTIEGWVKLADRPVQNQGLFGFRNNDGGGGAGDFYVLQVGNTNQIEARYRNSWNASHGGQQTFDYMTPDLAPNQWHHVVFTRKGGSLELYVNGNLIAQRVDTYGSIENQNISFQIGGQTNFADEYYSTGSIDEVAIYDEQLTAATVREHYQIGRDQLGQGDTDLTKRWVGAWVPGGIETPPLLDNYTTLAGQKPAVVSWFTSFAGGFNANHVDAAVSRGSVPMITWEPTGPNPSDYTLAKILNGDHDTAIRNFARDAATYDEPIMIRFAHEMNGTWYPWSPGQNGNTAAEYVQVWRKVHDIFAQEGADKVQWVWSPNVDLGTGTPTPFADVYPGDAYVDWVGMDGYNWGNNPGPEVWRSPEQIFGATYDELVQLAPSKPMMIAEVASAEAGGDKAAWINELFTTIPTRMCKVQGVVWFNENKERDWRIDSSSASLSAFSAAATSPTWNNTQAMQSCTTPIAADMNGDGIDDATQPNVMSYRSSVTQQDTVIEASASCQVMSAVSRPETVNSDADIAFDYPLGMMHTTLDCQTPGATTNIIQYYYDAPANDRYRLRGFVNGAYLDAAPAAFETVTINGRSVLKVTFSVQDGGPFDTDGQVNGSISAVLGVATQVVGAPNTGVRPY